MIKDLINFNRSYRRFFENEKIERDLLVELIDLARLSPSPKNLQALKFVIGCERAENNKIFPTLGWAGYLTDWQGPVAGERPSAYIIILADKSISSDYIKDYTLTACGIVAQSILLGAAEKGIGGCMIANIQRKKLQEITGINENFEILMVIALGKPKETVVIDEVDKTGSIRYWRDSDQVHHVPKRDLKELILK